MTAALEVKGRTSAVNDKITYAAEVQSVLRQLLHEVRRLSAAFRKRMTSKFLQTSSARMELVIIALIAVEVIIVGIPLCLR